jgi:hypothetical protein
MVNITLRRLLLAATMSDRSKNFGYISSQDIEFLTIMMQKKSTIVYIKIFTQKTCGVNYSYINWIKNRIAAFKLFGTIYITGTVDTKTSAGKSRPSTN